MRFDVYGGFRIDRRPDRLGVFDKNFWKQVSDLNARLPGACGCYIFALRHGKNIVPWYVGKTEKDTFETECFQPTKINYFNEVLRNHAGTPLLFLLPRLTGSAMRFSRPIESAYHDVDFLETLLIGLALEKNANLINVRKTKLLREMIVPGIMNSPPGSSTAPVVALRNALGRNPPTRLPASTSRSATITENR
jgi:hypothetical protein